MTLPDNSNKKITYYLILALILFTQCSCISYQDIPAAWEASDLTKTTECANISGSYWNTGEFGDQKNRPVFDPLLTNYLFETYESFNFTAKNIDHVVITQNGQESIQIKAFMGNHFVKERTLLKSSGDFSCDNGMVKVATSKIVAESIVIGIHHLSVGFTKQEGFLLTKRILTAFAPIFIPIYERETTWERFLEYTLTTNKKYNAHNNTLKHDAQTCASLNRLRPPQYNPNLL